MMGQMNEIDVKIDGRGRVTIPQALRKMMGFKGRATMAVKDGCLVVCPKR